MSTYLISYDLDKPGQDYSNLINAIQGLGGVKVLYSEWLVSTTYTAEQIYNILAPLIDRNDRLLVVGLTGVAVWWNMMADSETVKQLLTA